MLFTCLFAFIGLARNPLAVQKISPKPNLSKRITKGADELYVYILAGQSNMQGHANISTLPAMEADPKSRSLYRSIIDKKGQPEVYKNVWVASIGCGGDEYSDSVVQTGNLTLGFGASRSEIGPELMFGITVQKATHHPILIIKTSWGGRSLMTDFRPPIAGPRTYPDSLKKEWTRRGMNVAQTENQFNQESGVYYRRMMDYIKQVLANIQKVDPNYNPSQGFKLAGFVWFQGWNDMVDRDAYPNCMKPGGYYEYATLEENLIDNVRADLHTKSLPVVIGEMGVGGLTEGTKPPQSNFREAQVDGTLLPQFKGNVVAVPTAEFWDDSLDALSKRLQTFNDQFNKSLGSNSHLSDAEKEKARKQKLATTFTPGEIKEMSGISNYGFHYLGSAKIICFIGRAFGNAMLKLDQQYFRAKK